MVDDLFENNRRWAAARLRADPGFFERLAKQQTPRYMWIGCSDARVSADALLGLDPGEVFVHRNIANLAIHSDLNYLSVLQFAVEYLQVEHIIVCGHYGCGGVRAALSPRQLGLIDNWLRHIRDIRERYDSEFAETGRPEAEEDLLVELNTLTQAHNVARTPIVQNSWAKGRPLTVHGWVYRVRDGILHDLGCRISNPSGIGDLHRLAPRH
jgi:carbonic anhydrase